MTGKQLKILRIMKNIKAKEIAERLNVSCPYISMLEKETQAIPQHLLDKWLKMLV